MSHRPFGLRHLALSATGLDFGLRIRVDARPVQATLFSSGEASTQELAEELVHLVSQLRVYSFSLRSRMERVASALVVNLRCGFWPPARRAALDLADLLAEAAGSGLADERRCRLAERCALGIADLCAAEVQ